MADYDFTTCLSSLDFELLSEDLLESELATIAALSRCCSFTMPVVAVAVWSLNCLRLISEIKADELQRMREYLARE